MTTKKKEGEGLVWYVGTPLDTSILMEFIRFKLPTRCIPYPHIKKGLCFLLNHSKSDCDYAFSIDLVTDVRFQNHAIVLLLNL